MSETGRNPVARPVVYSLIFVFVAMVVIVAAGIWYTNYATRKSNDENNQKWCTVLVAIDDAYKDANVTSPAGKKIAEAFHMRRVEFNC